MTDGNDIDGNETGPDSKTAIGSEPVPAVPARHTARWVALGILVITAGLIAVLATRPPALTVEARSALKGKFAPPVAGATVDGAHFQLPRAPGHYVVLNFFASWCVPCRDEGPELVAFQFQHQRLGDASMVSVVFTDSTEDARNYQHTLGATWPTLADADGTLALAFGVRENPTTFVIAPNGRVVAVVFGGSTAAGLDGIIAKARASGYGA